MNKDLEELKKIIENDEAFLENFLESDDKNKKTKTKNLKKLSDVKKVQQVPKKGQQEEEVQKYSNKVEQHGQPVEYAQKERIKGGQNIENVPREKQKIVTSKYFETPSTSYKQTEEKSAVSFLNPKAITQPKQQKILSTSRYSILQNYGITIIAKKQTQTTYIFLIPQLKHFLIYSRIINPEYIVSGKWKVSKDTKVDILEKEFTSQYITNYLNDAKDITVYTCEGDQQKTLIKELITKIKNLYDDIMSLIKAKKPSQEYCCICLLLNNQETSISFSFMTLQSPLDLTWGERSDKQMTIPETSNHFNFPGGSGIFVCQICKNTILAQDPNKVKITILLKTIIHQKVMPVIKRSVPLPSDISTSDVGESEEETKQQQEEEEERHQESKRGAEGEEPTPPSNKEELKQTSDLEDKPQLSKQVVSEDMEHNKKTVKEIEKKKEQRTEVDLTEEENESKIHPPIQQHIEDQMSGKKRTTDIHQEEPMLEEPERKRKESRTETKISILRLFDIYKELVIHNTSIREMKPTKQALLRMLIWNDPNRNDESHVRKLIEEKVIEAVTDLIVNLVNMTFPAEENPNEKNEKEMQKIIEEIIQRNPKLKNKYDQPDSIARLKVGLAWLKTLGDIAPQVLTRVKNILKNTHENIFIEFVESEFNSQEDVTEENVMDTSAGKSNEYLQTTNEKTPAVHEKKQEENPSVGDNDGEDEPHLREESQTNDSNEQQDSHESQTKKLHEAPTKESSEELPDKDQYDRDVKLLIDIEQPNKNPQT